MKDEKMRFRLKQQSTKSIVQENVQDSIESSCKLKNSDLSMFLNTYYSVKSQSFKERSSRIDRYAQWLFVTSIMVGIGQ